MREQAKELIEREKLIVIIRGIPKDDLIPLCEALYSGGVRLAELPFDVSGSIDECEIASNIEMLCKHFGGKMTFGAGTVYTKKQVRLAARSGAEFILSPHTDAAVIKATKKSGLISIAGAFTPTETALAVKSGADFVKLFPATSLGTDYIRLIKTPMPDIKLFAIGGITLDNITDYKNAGIYGFGIGKDIVNRELINSGEFEKISEVAQKFINSIKG